MLYDRKFNDFAEAIKKEVKTTRNEAESKIEKYKSEKIDSAKQAAVNESNMLIKKRTDAVHDNLGREYSEKENQNRKLLFEKREQIKAEVFEEAKKKLIEFSLGENYQDFLLRSINSIKQNLFGRDKEISVYLKESDFKYKSLIQEKMVLPCNFFIDNDIAIGGVKIKFAGLIIDDTLDARLMSQAKWFEENSGLNIQ